MNTSTRLLRHRLPFLLAVLCAATLLVAGCDDDGDNKNNTTDTSDVTGSDTTTPSDTTGDTDLPDDLVVPETYTFESAFQPGVSSVAYDGQIARQVLIADLNATIGGLTNQIDTGVFMPAVDGEVVALLDFYFRFDSAAYGDEPIRLSTTPPTLQTTWNDISSNKDLVGKLAGNDASTDHKDWSTEFGGWSDASLAQYGGSIDSPEGFVVALFETLEENAIAHANGETRQGPGGEVLPVHLTETGLDLQQLTQKFLLGAINLSQGADDYLDDDIDGKGILADNSAPDGDTPFTSLEHAWDEGFGYFGAARHYNQLSDDVIASPGYSDANGDGAIDLLSEYNFGASTNAAKRDLGAEVPTDFTKDAMDAFLTGRAIITHAAGRALTDEELTRLRAERDKALFAWEAAIAATIVHYINDVLDDMGDFGTDDYSFADHAKHWSEMKGFALGLQFNPHSPVSDADFAELHRLLRDAPVLATSDSNTIEQYKSDLRAARALIGDAYGFAAGNLGDDDGDNGW